MDQSRRLRIWVALASGIAFTPVAVVLAVMSAGAGHGDYFAAKLLFPFTMLSTHWLGSITDPMIAVALIQFPSYGIVIAIGAWKRKDIVAALALVVLHGIGVLLCFAIPMPGF